MERVQLTITGMTCGHCARTIENHVRKLPGVEEIKVDWETGTAHVVLDPAVTTVHRILEDPIFARHYSARVASAVPREMR